MYEGRSHFPWATTSSNRNRANAQVRRSPDRVALWAVFLALFAIVVAAGTANASGGGVSAGSDGSGGSTGAKKHWKRGSATYYGPGMYGNQTACGQTLESNTIGVANNSLPCGTKVHFRYRGKVIRAKVIDRIGNGACFDLTEALKKKLRFPGSGKVKYAAAGDKRGC